MWERRYGFPKPVRDENGERQYSAAEVAKLRAIKRLMDVGLRPGKIIRAHARGAECAGRRPDRAAPRADVRPAAESEILALLASHDAPALQNVLANLLMRQGLQRFVLETLTSLNHAVGDAWMRGELAVFEEHLYTEQLQVALRTGINAFPRQAGAPRVLLTTFPGEQHGLGLLMVEALLVPGRRAVHFARRADADRGHPARGARARRAGRRACRSPAAFPVRQAGDGLASLRRQLPAKIAIWAGGEMTRRIRKALPGVLLVPDIAGDDGVVEVVARATQRPAPSSSAPR